jgi:hypothetical protein
MDISIRTAGTEAVYGGNVSDSGAVGKNKTIDARTLSLNFDKENYADTKRANARRQAMSIIGNAWDSDNSKSKKIQNLDEQRASLAEERRQYQSKMNDIDTSKEQLRDEYGVDENSSEQKDLELLEKYQRNKTGTSYEEFSDEEIARLKELQNEPLTEYQKRALELDNVKNGMDTEVQRIDMKLEALNMNILAARNEQAASQEMQDAQDMAGQILNAAERDVVLETINEAKETIDERRDESEEKAEEAEEKKAETDAADAKTKEERDNENIVKGESESDALELNQKLNSQSTDNVAEAQKQIAQIMKQNNLINEDIKGIDIDLSF